MFSLPMPPSTWMWIDSGSAARSVLIRSSASGMNFWPEYPGLMLMQSTRSASPATFGDVVRVGLGIERDADPSPWLARDGDRRGHVVDDLVVERDAVAAGLRELREVLRRVVDHQVAVDRRAVDRVDERRDRLQHDRPDRDRLDEVPVADVEVEDARARPQQHLDLVAEAREVGRVERRLDLDVVRIQLAQVTRAI